MICTRNIILIDKASAT